VPTCRADAMVDDIARARIQNRAQRGQRAALEVPWSGGNRPRAPQKWRPKVTFSLGRMYPSSPRAKQTTLSSFLASEWAVDNGKRSKTDAENEDQMSGKGSIESPGRMDTRAPDPILDRTCLAENPEIQHLAPNRSATESLLHNGSSTRFPSRRLPPTCFPPTPSEESSFGRKPGILPSTSSTIRAKTSVPPVDSTWMNGGIVFHRPVVSEQTLQRRSHLPIGESRGATCGTLSGKSILGSLSGAGRDVVGDQLV